MLLKFPYILLAFEAILLALKYGILKCFTEFKTFIELGRSNNKTVNKKLNIYQIVKFSNKLFKILKINSCLVRSMTLKELLNKRGYEATLLIGIKNDTGSFESHCWLEIQNNFYTDNKDVSKFKVIRRI